MLSTKRLWFKSLLGQTIVSRWQPLLGLLIGPSIHIKDDMRQTQHLLERLGGWLVVFVAESRWLNSTTSRHVWTLGKSPFCLYTRMHVLCMLCTTPSLVVACMTWCGALRGCLAAKFDSCNSLLSPFHTLLVIVNILRCVRLYNIYYKKIIILLLLV